MTDQPSTLDEALLQLQGRLPTIAKSKTAKIQAQGGSGFAYKYADLSLITKKMLPILGELGLTWTCRPTMVDGRFVLAYALKHVQTGESLNGEYPLPTTGTPQQIGAALTYSRRYALTAVTGLCPDDDDTDAAAAVHEPDRPEPRERQQASRRREPSGTVARKSDEQDEGPRMASVPQIKKLHTMLGKAGHTDPEAKLHYCSAAIGREISSTSELTLRECAQVISGIENALAESHNESPDGDVS